MSTSYRCLSKHSSRKSAKRLDMQLNRLESEKTDLVMPKEGKGKEKRTNNDVKLIIDGTSDSQNDTDTYVATPTPDMEQEESAHSYRLSITSITTVPNSIKSGNLFEGVYALLVPNRMQSESKNFAVQIPKYRGSVSDVFSCDITHVIVNIPYEFVMRLLKWSSVPMGVHLISKEWIIQCLQVGVLVSTTDYLLSPPAVSVAVTPAKSTVASPLPSTGIQRFHDVMGRAVQAMENTTKSNEKSSYDDQFFTEETENHVVVDDDDNDDDDDDDDDDPNMKVKDLSWMKKFVCSRASSTVTNVNEAVTDILKALQQHYYVCGDTYRELGFQKAAGTVSKLSYTISVHSTVQELTALPFIGDKTALIILDFLRTNKIARLEGLGSDFITIQRFIQVWGAGPTTAKRWIQLGYQSLEDVLRLGSEQGILTEQQRIGIELYDDLLERIPRIEVEEIERRVREGLDELPDGEKMKMKVCGSYRRGKTTCGDVDILITHSSVLTTNALLQSLLSRLRSKQFITHTLSGAHGDGSQSKWMGVCVAGGSFMKHRRLDLIVTPFNEWGAALLYFTGSSHFNRSMRCLAKVYGFSLSQHALYRGVLRKTPYGKKLTDGEPMPLYSEMEIMEALNLEYLKPEERNM